MSRIKRTKSWFTECGKFRAYGHANITICFDKPRKFLDLTVTQANDLLIVLKDALSCARKNSEASGFLENLRLGKTK